MASSSASVNVVAVRGGEVLLTRREDFDVWCLPGGHVDPGEPLRAAAARELLEETGYDVDGAAGVGELVGEYLLHGAWQELDTSVFVADLTGCGRREQTTPFEVTDLRWFAVDDLPDLLWWQRPQLRDALAGRRGIVWCESFSTPYTGIGRAAAYAARDASGLGRRAFFDLAYPSRLGEPASAAA